MRRGSSDDGMGCVVAAIACLFAMPIVGAIIFFKGAERKDDDAMILGGILTVVGIILTAWMSH